MVFWLSPGSSKEAELTTRPTEDMTKSKEDTPLVLQGDGTFSPGNDRWVGLWPKLAATSVAVVLLSVGLISHSVMMDHEEKGVGGQIITAEEQTTTGETVSYRPVCETYSGNVAKIVQTSLGQPSQQWSTVPCYPVPQEKYWFSGSYKTPTIDMYGVPDAILQVNFSQLAHPDRSVEIIGFGGAFTEASALNYESLSQEGKDTVMELLFGKSGLGYSLGRVHMNSCDFSVKSYSFDDTDGDFDLKDFDVGVHHDVSSGMIDMMLRATSVLRAAWGPATDGKDGNLQIYASPWSPPPWMKAPTPDDAEGALHAEYMTNSAQPTCLRDGVGPHSQYAKAWALYFSKFLTAYEDLGVPLFAITIQNEPEFPAPWEACSYTPETQGDFLANHLGPQLRESHPNVKIFIFDHNKDHAPVWIKALLNTTNPASQYVDGTAIHWYAGGMDRLLDGAQGAPNMHRVLADLKELKVPKSHIVFGSEACHCPYTAYGGGDINVAWARAERYAHTILSDLAAGSNGWVEWNLLLDSIGGPNHLGNLCDTTLLAVPHRAVGASGVPETMDFEHTGHKFGRVVGDDRTREELNALGFPAKYLDAGVVVQPMYYYMGHISRHVRPGSTAVKALVNHNNITNTVQESTFRPKGSVVAGGGLNDLARDGIEVTVWPCEGSTRQEFKWNEDKQLQVFGHDWLGLPTTSCIGVQVHVDYLGLMLGSCNMTDAMPGIFELVPYSDEDAGDYVNFRMTNGKKGSQKNCLVIKELRNSGGAYGPRGGAQVTLGKCDTAAARWSFSPETGEISSCYFSDGNVCMTTGWPFLQMGAFHTPNGETDQTIVLLNEAGESANYILRNGNDLVLTGSIPAHSIQTIMLEPKRTL